MNVLQKISAGITCAIITKKTDPVLYEQWESLRGKIWVRKYQEKDLGGTRERDAHDSDVRTLYITLIRGDVVVGGCRLIFDTFAKGSVEVSRFCQDAQMLQDVDCDELCKEFITAIDLYIGQVLGHAITFVTIRRQLLERIAGYGWEVIQSGIVDSHGSKEFPHAVIRTQSYVGPNQWLTAA